jgi:hypothetical protein
VSKAAILRLLGHVLLCGALHVAYSTNDRVKGHYVICVLYRSSLVLASASKAFMSYNVVANIPLLNATLEASDNGRGQYCSRPCLYSFLMRQISRVTMSHCTLYLENSIRIISASARGDS